ncbi:MAG: asparagine synthase (glutamine-hydrolyzing) [Acidobacteria bacterium]|nr:asparagine synthase (glutamine-hydrolyzing) [Acidobacteriota bacterium]
MCGIAGAAWTDPARAVDEQTLVRMTSQLVHRGPDQSGTYLGDRVALGHRRLSIIGLADGRQPIANEDGSLIIVFNGEIYNYLGLRTRLLEGGHRFRTNTDTEVIVHLFEDLGTECFAQLNGMFSLAIWDTTRQRLVLARDRLGKKPLVYYSTRDRIVFASELKAIVELDDVPRRLAPRAIDAYLTYLYVPHPMTIFEGISKLEPGCFATWSGGELRVARYWNPDLNEEDRTASEGEWSERLAELLKDAVRLRLQSEVPLGAFLSGGIDSSIVAGLMQELSSSPVRTFSIGSPIKEFDETDYARSVARHLGVEHREFIVAPDALEILPQLVWHYDEPFADSSAIPTWYVSKLTREHVTVALTGDGGDELFAGYDRYKALRVAQAVGRLPQFVRRALGSAVWQGLPGSPYRKSFLRRLKRFLAVVDQPPHELYLTMLTTFAATERIALYSDDFANGLAGNDPLEFVRGTMEQSSRRDLVTSAMLTDLKTYLVCDLMTKVDIASMAHSLECRQPFLDYRVVELAARMPLRFKLRRGRTKRILVDTFERYLPREVQRRSKMGFGVPLIHWLRGPLAGFARDVLEDPRCAQRGMFSARRVTTMLDEHIGGHQDHSARLWALLVLELWQRRWVDR